MNNPAPRRPGPGYGAGPAWARPRSRHARKPGCPGPLGRRRRRS
ncbi:hypothetical protein ATKI12_8338 [Kitasatospora sp. Ki12]